MFLRVHLSTNQVNHVNRPVAKEKYVLLPGASTWSVIATETVQMDSDVRTSCVSATFARGLPTVLTGTSATNWRKSASSITFRCATVRCPAGSEVRVTVSTSSVRLHHRSYLAEVTLTARSRCPGALTDRRSAPAATRSPPSGWASTWSARSTPSVPTGWSA